MARRIMLTVLAVALSLVVSGIALNLALIPTNRTAGPILGTLGTLAVLVPLVRAVWHWRMTDVAFYHALAGAFLCFWTANADSPEKPFTAGQWALLGLSLLVVAISVRWRKPPIRSNS